MHNEEAIQAVYSYFGAIAAKEYEKAYQLRTNRTRQGYSLKQFSESWAQTGALRIVFAKQVSLNEDKSKVELVLSESQATGKKGKVIRTTQRGTMELVFEDGGWHFDGGSLGEYRGEWGRRLSSGSQPYLQGFGWGETFADQLHQDAGEIGGEANAKKRIHQALAGIGSSAAGGVTKKDLADWKSGAMDGALARIRERFPNERFAPVVAKPVPRPQPRPSFYQSWEQPKVIVPKGPGGPGYPVNNSGSSW
ncbi:MAG: hypothetical protein KIS61_33620 [Candidatus Eremiobacteraeota bacterium]|nr:hypothetical protein [Candidatus Eremiobacteraeota bacterium]